MMSALGRGDDLQWGWTTNLLVFGGTGAEEIVSADVHHYEVIPSDETAAVRTGGKAVTTDKKGLLRNEVSLVFLLYLT